MLVEQQLKGSQIIERRAKRRIYASYPAIVQGKDANGKKVRGNATLINFSSIGLCLILKPQIHLQGELFVLFHCSVTGSLGKVKAPTIAIRGNVIRSSTTAQGMQSVAVEIRHSRFL
jgi:hypothetical protein